MLKKNQQIMYLIIVSKYIFILNNLLCTGQRKKIINECGKSKFILHEFKILLEDQQKIIRWDDNDRMMVLIYN